MKKKILTLLILCILMILTGCVHTEKIMNSENSENVAKFIELEGFNKVKLNCNPISNVVDFSNYQSLFITKDGNLYQISYDKIFSNETNCQQIESDKKFIRFIKGGILDSNNDIYYYDDSKNLVLYRESMGSIIMPNQMIERIPKNKYPNIIYSDEDSKYGDNQMYYFYYDSEKNEIFNYSIDLSTISKEAIYSLESDETMEYITYGGIKTNKGFYVYGRQASNKEECEKYADVKCKTKNSFYRIDNSNITNQFNHIKFIQYDGDSYFIIDDNNNFYTNVMGG